MDVMDRQLKAHVKLDSAQQYEPGFATTKMTLNKSIIIVILSLLLLTFTFLSLVSLSAVVVLTAKVGALEARFESRCSKDTVADGTSADIPDTTTPVNIPDIVTPGNIPDTVTPGNFVEEGIDYKNLTTAQDTVERQALPEPKQRNRRQIISCNSTQHVFTHVTGIVSEQHCANWVTWHLPTEPIYDSLSTDMMEVDYNTFIEITVPGYYYVYGQLTYYHRHDTAAPIFGFEIVKLSCPDLYETVLLQSRTLQIQQPHIPGIPRARSGDSAYVGGVFYFNYRDLIGLRKLPVNGGEPDLYEEQPDTSNYFGAILQMRNHNPHINHCVRNHFSC